MHLLLDTHVLLWWLGDSPRLGPASRTRMADPRARVFVSAATGWEISIKRALGELKAPADLDALLDRAGFERLAITFHHGEAAGDLPPLHRDPFDRMLVAQARLERLALVTADEAIRAYDVETVDPTR